MTGGLIYTTGDKPTDRHSIIPSQDNSVFISGRGGKISADRTLPVPVQNNIDAENIRFSDSTVNDTSTGKHGFMPKLTGEADDVFTGLGWGKLPETGSGFANIWWVKARQTVTIGDVYENVVSKMKVDGILRIYGVLKILP